MNNESLLDIKNLELSFFTSAGEVKALNGISLSIKKGDIIGIVGESGSGKSVTAHAIMGLLPKNSKIKAGTIDFDGIRITDLKDRELCKIRGNDISIIFQDPMTSLNPVFTVGNQVAEVIITHKIAKKSEVKKKVIEMFSLVGINDPERRYKQYPFELSGGMRQRVMIAMALACNPKLLIADEPTTALDVTIQAQILELMKELKEKLSMSIIMITHDLGIVSNMCDKIAVMYGGRIVEYGTIYDIFYNPMHEYTRGLLRSIPKLSQDVNERLIPIEGNAIDVLDPPPGCPFSPRCQSCMKICLREMPEYTKLTDTHYSACWLIQKEELEKGQG